MEQLLLAILVGVCVRNVACIVLLEKRVIEFTLKMAIDNLGDSGNSNYRSNR